MTGEEYTILAMRTNDGNASSRLLKKIDESGICVGSLLDGCLGLSGEAGEFNDIVKKWIFHEKDFDEEHAKKEMGDVMWYVAMICYSLNWDLDEIMQMNIDKLRARYPEGFDINKANNRKPKDI